MPEYQVKIEGLKELKERLSNYPDISKPIFAQAINVSLLEIQKEAVDENFQFKTPRSQRTGYLKLSFKYGFQPASENKLQGSIGPTAKYALFVHEGHSQHVGRFVPAIGKRLVKPYIPGNPFMLRIVQKVEPKINKVFREALDNLVKKLAGN